ncbi:MAG: endonuclease/exonuclease/phosphatase family protein [Chloroflexota bacterium]
MLMKVVSWNIWLGKRLPGVLDFLREQSADIVGLQELDAVGDQVGDIANGLGYQHVFYPANQGAVDTGKGDAVLSRYPILGSARHFLGPSVEYDGTPTTEPRIAVEATLAVNNTTLTVYSTHLAYAAHFKPSPAQTVQGRALAELVQGKEKVLVMGDFNALPASDVVKTLASVLNHADSDLSAPSFTVYPHEYEDHKTAELRDRVDYLFISRDINAVEAGVSRSKASNHLPIWATLEV